MNMSFYTAALAAVGQQERMNVISNNIANINTEGYKSKDGVFADLMYYNLREEEGVDSPVRAGSGIMMQRTNTDFQEAAQVNTDGAYDYAISGRGFFMLQNPDTEEITYTRNGKFGLSLREGSFYLVNDGGRLVLDADKNPIVVQTVTSEAQAQENLEEPAKLPGAFTFPVWHGMLSAGNNEWKAAEKNGEPILAEDAMVHQGFLEQSNVSLADEMTKTIECSRAYSYVLKMIQTSDEVEQTINSLR